MRLRLLGGPDEGHEETVAGEPPAQIVREHEERRSPSGVRRLRYVRQDVIREAGEDVALYLAVDDLPNELGKLACRDGWLILDRLKSGELRLGWQRAGAYSTTSLPLPAGTDARRGYPPAAAERLLRAAASGLDAP
jgi:hypothetical protein